MTSDMDIDFTRRNKKPRPLSDHEKEKLDEFIDAIHYSARYAAHSKDRVAPLLTMPKVFRRRVRVPTCAASEADAEDYTQRLLRRCKGHAEATVGGRVASTGDYPSMTAIQKSENGNADLHLESRLGTLRSPRTRAAYPSLQVSAIHPGGRWLLNRVQATDQLPAAYALRLPRSSFPYGNNVRSTSGTNRSRRHDECDLGFVAVFPPFLSILSESG